MDIYTPLLVVSAFLVAGMVKGTVGLGMPTTAIGLMTLALAPRTAIALVLIPMLVTNAWQVWRSGEILRALSTYRVFALALIVGVLVTFQFTKAAPDRVLLALLGAAVLVFVAVNAFSFAPALPDRLDRVGQGVAGTAAGVMGGLTAVWAPPLAIYLAARRADKTEFVRASGLLIFLGSIPLAASYVSAGIADARLLFFSACLLLPSLVGFSIGEALRGHLSEANFRKLLLFVFFLLGANLIRRAVFEAPCC